MTRQIFIDSAAFVAWFYLHDAHYQRAGERFSWIERERLLPVTSDLVIVETATVLSHRQGQVLARTFLEFVQKVSTIHVNEELLSETYQLFSQQERRGSSVVDCCNVVVMRRLDIPTIFSFDEVFAKDFHLDVAA